MRTLTEMFRTPSARALATAELAEAERQLLKAQSGLDYARNMVTYRTQQVERLRKYLDQNA